MISLQLLLYLLADGTELQEKKWSRSMGSAENGSGSSNSERGVVNKGGFVSVWNSEKHPWTSQKPEGTGSRLSWAFSADTSSWHGERISRLLYSYAEPPFRVDNQIWGRWLSALQNADLIERRACWKGLGWRLSQEKSPIRFTNCRTNKYW